MSQLVAYQDTQQNTRDIQAKYKGFVQWYSTSKFGSQIINKLRNSTTNNQINKLLVFWSIAQSMVDNIDWFTLMYIKHGIDENVLLSGLEMQRGGVKIKRIVNGVEIEEEVDAKKQTSKLFRIIDATVALLTTVVVVGTGALYVQQGTSVVQSVQAPVAAGALLEFGRAYEDAEVIAAAFGYTVFNMSDTTQTATTSALQNTRDFFGDVCGQLDNITTSHTGNIYDVIQQCPDFNMTCLETIGGLALDLASSVVLSGSGAFEYVNAFDVGVPSYGGNELWARSPDPGSRFQFPLKISTGSTYGLYLQGKPVVDDITKNVTMAIDKTLGEYGVQNLDQLIAKLDSGTSNIAMYLLDLISRITMTVSSTENVEKLKRLQPALVEFNKASVYIQKVNPRLHMLLVTLLKEKILGFPQEITMSLIRSEIGARKEIAEKMSQTAMALPGRLSAAPTSAMVAFGEAQQVGVKVGSKVNAAKAALGGGGGGPSAEMFVFADIAAANADAYGGVDVVGRFGGGKKRRKSKKVHRKTNKKRTKRTR